MNVIIALSSLKLSTLSSRRSFLRTDADISVIFSRLREIEVTEQVTCDAEKGVSSGEVADGEDREDKRLEIDFKRIIKADALAIGKLGRQEDVT